MTRVDAVISTYIDNKSCISNGIEEAGSTKLSTKRTSIWLDTSTQWSTLGRLFFPYDAAQSGRILIERIF